MCITIVSKKNIDKADNWSAELWTLPSAKEENFDIVFSDSEYEILGLYIHRVCKTQKFGISSSLLSKISSYLKEAYVDKTGVKIILSSAEKIQMNIVLKECLTFAKELMVSEKEVFSAKINKIIDLENRLKGIYHV